MKWARWLGFYVVYFGIALGVTILLAFVLDLRSEVATLVATLFIVFVWIPLANRVGSLFGVTPMPPDDPASIRLIPIDQVHEHLQTRKRY